MLCFTRGSYNIVLTCHIYTHIPIRARAHTHIHTQTHTHTHPHTHTHTDTDLNFAIFWKDSELNTRVIETMLVREI